MIGIARVSCSALSRQVASRPSSRSGHRDRSGMRYLCSQAERLLKKIHGLLTRGVHHEP
jgi:hypothetical protein